MEHAARGAEGLQGQAGLLSEPSEPGGAAPAALNPTAASLLGFLETFGPLSGYDIVSLVEASIGYFWNVTRSQVYRELTRLAEGGFVLEGESGHRSRRPFTITPTGSAAFAQWLASTPGPDIMRLPFLLTYFFGQHLDPSLLTAFAAVHRDVHQERLDYFRSIIEGSKQGSEQGLEAEQPFMAHVAELGVAYEETMLAWFDAIPDRLARLAAAEPEAAAGPVAAAE